MNFISVAERSISRKADGVLLLYNASTLSASPTLLETEILNEHASVGMNEAHIGVRRRRLRNALSERRFQLWEKNGCIALQYCGTKRRVQCNYYTVSHDNAALNRETRDAAKVKSSTTKLELEWTRNVKVRSISPPCL